MSSRAKFSLGWAATLVAVSSHRCMAGSLATAAVRVSKLPAPRVRNSWFCRYIKAGAANLFEPGGEVARPEKGELLAERGGRHDHPVDPPCLEGGLLAVLFLALLGGRLPVLAACGRPPARRGEPAARHAQGGEGQPVALGVRTGEAGEKGLDGRLVPRRHGGVELVGAGPESGPPVQMSEVTPDVGHAAFPPFPTLSPTGAWQGSVTTTMDRRCVPVWEKL